MKVSQKKYDIKFRNKNQLKLERSLRAASRLESYSFYKSDTSSLLSSEIQGNLILKREYYESKSHESIWTDRNSLIAAPHNAELFLQNDRMMSSERFLGAPRFYFHELSSPSKIPNARLRFPYDRLAHQSAKVITRLFRYNLHRRIHAAMILKRNFRRHLKNKLSTLEWILWNKCITMLQKLFRRRRNLFKENAAWYRQNYFNELEKKRLMKEEDLRKNLLGAQKIRLTIAYYHLTRRAREFIKRKRRERGIRRREFNYACRVQAVYRGRKTRKILRIRKSAGIFLLFVLRRHWKRKYLKYILKIQRIYRNFILKKNVILIQKMIRRKIGMRRRDRLRLEMIAAERHRANRECLVMTDYLHQLSLDLRWMNDDEQIPFITTEDHLKRIDFYSLCCLTNHPLQLQEPYVESIHPADYGEDDYVDNEGTRLTTYPNKENLTLEEKITMTILNLFSNRPGGCLDGTVFRILKDSNYFKLSLDHSPPHHSRHGRGRGRGSDKNKSSGNGNEKSSVKNKSSGKSSGNGDATSLWESLEKLPLLNIFSLCQILKPTKALLFQVKLLGSGRYLPTQLLRQALLINRWTLFFEFLLRRKLKKFRKLYPPRRACVYCLEPMIFDGELYDHRRCCRNGFPSWMINDMREIYDVLREQCRIVAAGGGRGIGREIDYRRDYGDDLKRLKEGMKMTVIPGAAGGGGGDKTAKGEGGGDEGEEEVATGGEKGHEGR